MQELYLAWALVFDDGALDDDAEPVAPDTTSLACLTTRIDRQCISLLFDVIAHYREMAPLHCHTRYLLCDTSADSSNTIPLVCQ